MSTPSEICLVGHPFVHSSRGEDIRVALRAFRAVGIKPKVHDVHDFLKPDAATAEFLGDSLTDTLSGGVNIFFLNGDEVSPPSERLTRRLQPSAHNIIYPAWELPLYPAAWAEAVRGFSECWAMSKYTYDGLVAAEVPNVFHLTQPNEPVIRDFLGRRYFNLPDAAYLLFTFFRFRFLYRKKEPNGGDARV